MTYEPFDQANHLGDPPWRPGDHRLTAWERAHGHDARLKCYPEFGCLVIEPALDHEVATLRDEIERLRGALNAIGRSRERSDDLEETRRLRDLALAALHPEPTQDPTQLPDEREG
jgi:hypothetical protein